MCPLPLGKFWHRVQTECKRKGDGAECPGSCSAHCVSTEVKSCQFWLLTPLSSGLDTPGCLCATEPGVLLGAVPAAGNRDCIPRTWLCTLLPAGGLHRWARRAWVTRLSSQERTGRAGSQMLQNLPWVGHGTVERKSAAGWQKLAGCSSHHVKYKPCLIWHRLLLLSALAPLWEQESFGFCVDLGSSCFLCFEASPHT